MSDFKQLINILKTEMKKPLPGKEAQMLMKPNIIFTKKI